MLFCFFAAIPTLPPNNVGPKVQPVQIVEVKKDTHKK